MTRRCSFPGCDRKYKTVGLCDAHYHQQLRGTPLHPVRDARTGDERCSFEGCDRKRYAKGLCSSHYEQQRRTTHLRPLKQVQDRLCSFPGCGRKHRAKGLCSAHWAQQAAGRVLVPIGGVPVGRKPQPKAAEPKAPKAPKPANPKLPKGWGRHAPKPRDPKPSIDSTDLHLPIVPPVNPRLLAAGLVALRDLGADDLADAFGVTPDHIRAEAERWRRWDGDTTHDHRTEAA